MIKVIIFDLGNVLVHYDLRKAVERFARDCRVSVLKTWFHFLTSTWEKAYCKGEISSREFYRQAKRSLGFSADFRSFYSGWNQIFWENGGMEALLRVLKKRYPLLLITNTNKMHYEYIKKKFRLLRHFKAKLASHEVGLAKPDPRIFRRAIAEAGCRPEECVFIDDNPEFLRGAAKAGMKTILFTSREKLIGSLEKIGVVVRELKRSKVFVSSESKRLLGD
jgi:putative hydrolase of the HAD superfamily